VLSLSLCHCDSVRVISSTHWNVFPDCLSGHDALIVSRASDVKRVCRIYLVAERGRRSSSVK